MTDRSIDFLFGGGTRVAPGQTLSPIGIASAEAWGTPKIGGPIKGAGGIASREAWGSPKLSFTIRPTGIVSREAWGSDRLVLALKPSGIASREAWGTPRLGLTIKPSGIHSAEAWGSPKIAGPIKGAGGIASREAWGTPKLSFTVKPSGIASREAWGSPKIAGPIKGAGGIASREAWGSPKLSFTIHPSGIASREAWGSDVLGLALRPGGIASAEAWGTPRIGLFVKPSGIPSAEAWGSPRMDVNVKPGGIASAEAWGDPRIMLFINPTGIPSSEAWGHPIAAGPIKGAGGIASAEAWGSPRMGLTIFPSGIPSAEAWFVPTVVGPVIESSIPSAEAWGSPHLGRVVTPWDRERGGNQMRLAPITAKAVGTIQVVDGSRLVEGDSFVLNDGDPSHTPTSFMYFRSTLSPGFVGIHFFPSDDVLTIKGATIAAINGVGAPLSISAAPDPGPVIALGNDNVGPQGNQPIVESVADPGFIVSGMEGGALNDGIAGIPSAPEGAYVFVLGYQMPGLTHLFRVGDFAEVSQEADIGSTKLIRARVIVRPTIAMPPGVAWRVSIGIDGVEFVGRTLEPGRGRSFVDLAANVSGLSGSHTLSFRVELIDT